MTLMKRFPLVIVAFSAAVGAGSIPVIAQAVPRKNTVAKVTSKPASAQSKPLPAPLPRYVSLATIKRLREERARNPLPILQPFLEGESLKGKDLKDLATNPP